MERGHYCLYLIVIFVFFGYSYAEISHWQKIKVFLEDGSEHAAVQYEDYIKSLNTAELIQAAKQCCEEIELSTAPQDWDAAAGKLAFFYVHYPLKSGDLQDITSLLKDMEDKTENLCWRCCLMQLLGVEWREKLNVNATLKVADRMYVIYRDISESMQLKPKAIRLQAILLLQAYKKNLSEDPAIKALMKESKGSSRNYIQEFQSGRIELSEKTTHTNKSILNRINISATEQLKIFSGNQSSAPTKIQIIEAWTRWRKYNLDPPEVSQYLFSAISNYKNFDSELWVPLAKANVEDFENQNASVKLKEMITEAKDEDIKKRLQLAVRKNTSREN